MPEFDFTRGTQILLLATVSVVSVGSVGLEVFVWFLIVKQGIIWNFLAISLCILGGVLVIIGGYVAHKEWEI